MPVKGSRFLRRIPTTSEAVQPHSAMRTSSTGLLAVFSLPASTTMAWPEFACPTNRSRSDQFTEASIIFPLLRLTPVVCHRLGMNQHAKKFSRLLLKPDFECGLHVVDPRQRHVIGERTVAGNVQSITNLLELKLMYIY